MHITPYYDATKIKYVLTYVFTCFIILQSIGQSRVLMNQDWQFVKDIDTILYDDIVRGMQVPVSWEKVNLPHTANIEPVIKAQQEWQGICFYKKELFVDSQDKDKHIALQFDGAMSDASIYLNGKLLTRHLGGYLPFYVDFSDKLIYGARNEILVKLDNRDNKSIPPGKPLDALDFNYYSGLYRNVTLVKKDRLHISHPVASQRVAGGGVLLHYDSVSNDVAFLTIQTDIKNDNNTSKRCRVHATLLDREGNKVAQDVSDEVNIPAHEFGRVQRRIHIQNPALWSPDSPTLYQLLVQVRAGDKVIDEEIIRTGIRKIFIKDGQLYLNGEHIILRGTNRHQEYPYIGNALSDNAQYRDAWKIKSAGFNFVRTAHYPHATAFLEACDELGLLVMDAIPGWQFFGGEDFVQNSYQDIRDMVRRDRNHPSVVFWEASLNESGMSKDYMTKAHHIVKEELPFANIYTAGWKDFAYDIFIPARQHAKAPHYWKNYVKNKPILISEYGDWEYYAHNAGFNQKEFKDLQSEERTSRQLRGFGQKRLLQQALNYQESHNDNLYGKILGDANWLMFDYKRGYAEDIESSGIMDIMRIPKFSYYFYQSQCHVKPSSLFHKPVLFIANYWKTQADTVVKVFSNCDEVELFLNGKSIGRQSPDQDANSTNLKHPPFTFNVSKFEPGKLEAIGYLNKKRIIDTFVETSAETYTLKIEVDESGKKLEAGVNDVVFVYVYLMDRKENVVYDGENMVCLHITKGDAEIVGPKSVKAEAGIASFLLKIGEKKSVIALKATSETLQSGVLRVNSL